jgi:protein gp37
VVPLISAPLNHRPRNTDDPREVRILVGSMTDMWSRWVPREWIEAVLAVMREVSHWEFLPLTSSEPHGRVRHTGQCLGRDQRWSRGPRRVGRGGVRQYRRFGDKVNWLSCEPLLEPLQFQHLDRVDWIVGGDADVRVEAPRESVGIGEFQNPDSSGDRGDTLYRIAPVSLDRLAAIFAGRDDFARRGCS